MWRIAASLLFAIGVCSCEPEREPAIEFPRAAPRVHRAPQQLALLAGSGAVNCGVATDISSSAEVYACAANALASHQGFYCLYSVRDATTFNDHVGYIGRQDGVVLEARENPPGTYTRGAMVLIPGATPPPRRIGPGMTVPIVTSSAVAALSGKAMTIDGIVIIEAAIGPDGRVSDARVLKPLPFGIDADAERLVREATFQPSRFFGVPVTVLDNVTVDARAGQLQIRRIPGLTSASRPE